MAMTGAEFDERVHFIDETGVKIKRRFWDRATGKDGEAVAYPFKKDACGKKLLNQNAFDDIWPMLRTLARCQPEDKLTLVSGLRTSNVFRDREHLKNLAKDDIHVFPDYQVREWGQQLITEETKGREREREREREETDWGRQGQR